MCCTQKFKPKIKTYLLAFLYNIYIFILQGFAKNQFNFGKGYEHLGNKVKLVTKTSSPKSVECEIHKDGCTEEQIMCTTR